MRRRTGRCGEGRSTESGRGDGQGDVEKEDQLRVGEEMDRAMWRRKISREWGRRRTGRCGEGRSAENGRGDGQGDVEKEDQLRVGEETDRAMWRRKIS